MSIYTEADGRELAVEMLRKLGEEWENGEEDLEGTWEENLEVKISREPATLRRYLATIRETPALERGFLCVLNELIGATVSGCPMDPDDYEPVLLRARGDRKFQRFIEGVTKGPRP